MLKPVKKDGMTERELWPQFGVGSEALPQEELERHFSAETLGLIGPEIATQLVRAHDYMQANITESCRHSATRPEPQRGNLRAFFDKPEHRTACSRVLNLIESARQKDPKKSPTQPYFFANIANPLYDVYIQFKDAFIPLSDEKLEEDLTADMQEIPNIRLLKDKAEALLATYETAANDMERATILGELTESFEGVRLPRVALVTALDYLAIESVFAAFERLEKKHNDPARIIEGFAKDGTLAFKDDCTDVINLRFRLPHQLNAGKNRLHAFSRESHVYIEITDLMERHHQLNRAFGQRVARELMGIGARAIGQAEASLRTALGQEGEADYSRFPYSLLELDSPVASQELEAMRLLERALPLQAARKEIETFFTTFAFGDEKERPHLKEDWDCVASTAEWRQALTQAREILTPVLAEAFDTLAAEFKPIITLATGRKPRPGKNPTDEELAAEMLYSELHKSAVFSDTEKAVIAAIAGGTWPALLSAGRQAYERYEAISTLARKYESYETFAGHPAHKIGEFHPGVVLAEIQRRIDHSSGRQYLSVLTNEQYDAVVMAILELTDESSAAR